MKKNESKEINILDLLQEKYEINTIQDISFAVKDLFKDTLQQMMNKDFDESIGYEKYDNKTNKSNYRKGITKKK